MLEIAGILGAVLLLGLIAAVMLSKAARTKADRKHKKLSGSRRHENTSYDLLTRPPADTSAAATPSSSSSPSSASSRRSKRRRKSSSPRSMIDLMAPPPKDPETPTQPDTGAPERP